MADPDPDSEKRLIQIRIWGEKTRIQNTAKKLYIFLFAGKGVGLESACNHTYIQYVRSVVEPEPPFLAGAGKKGVAPDPALTKLFPFICVAEVFFDGLA